MKILLPDTPVIQQIENEREELRKEVAILVARKKEKYFHIDISMPMSEEEKKLNVEIAGIFSKMNKLVKIKRSLKNER